MIKKFLLVIVIFPILFNCSCFAKSYIAVDKNNNKIIDTIFEDVSRSVNNEYYLIRTYNRKFGLFNSNGEIILEPKYTRIIKFPPDKYIVDNNKIIDKKEHVFFAAKIKDFYYDNKTQNAYIITDNEDDTTSVYDKNLKKIISINKKRCFLNRNMGGYIEIKDDNFLVGIFDLEPRKMLELNNSKINDILYYNKNKFFIIYDLSTKKYGVIDIDKKIIIPVLYDYIKFDNKTDLFKVTQNRIETYYNFDGEVVSNIIQTDTTDKKESVKRTQGEGWGYGYKSKSSYKHPIFCKVMSKIPYINQVFGLSEFFGITHFSDYKYTIYDDKGRKIFKNVSSKDYEHYFRNAGERKYLIYNNTVYDRTTMKKYHIKSNTNPIYLGDDKFLITRNNKKMIIDINNNEIIKDNYSDLKTLAIAYNGDYSYISLLVIEKNGKYGIIDQNGQEKIPAIYEQIKLREGYPHIILNAKKDGKWGRIDSTNTVLNDFIYDFPPYFIFDNGSAIVEIDGNIP